VTARLTSTACWTPHVGLVHASAHMTGWLADQMSLTMKLKSRCASFRVQRLWQRQAIALQDEFTMLALPKRQRVREREVILRCDERPVVYAHTVVPLSATAADWPFFGGLGERSLGTTLFGDPHVRRGRLEFARLGPRHVLVRRARAVLGLALPQPVFARRCLYQRNRGLLLVTEVFLPAIAAWERPGTRAANRTGQ